MAKVKHCFLVVKIYLEVGKALPCEQALLYLHSLFMPFCHFPCPYV